MIDLSCRYKRAFLIIPPYFLAGHLFLIFPVPPLYVFGKSRFIQFILSQRLRLKFSNLFKGFLDLFSC